MEKIVPALLECQGQHVWLEATAEFLLGALLPGLPSMPLPSESLCIHESRYR